MKERFLAGLKNAAVIIIASFMLLGVIPLGMISHISTVNAEGEFLRLQPDAMISVAEETVRQDEGNFSELKDTYAVSQTQYSYLKFDLRQLQDRKADTMSRATLRLAFLRTPAEEKVPVRLWLMPNDRWSKSMKWKDKPSKVGEVPVATVALSPSANEEPQLFEIELTEYLKKWMEEERDTVSFRLDCLGGDVTAAFAGTSHEDPLFRPCLKIVTGAATDPDEKTLRKVSLSQKYASKQSGKTVAIAKGKNEIYLKFSLNENNIQGAIYQANLRLSCLKKDPEALLRIEQMEDTNWTAKSIKQGRKPGGTRRLVYREEDATDGTYENINLTEVMNRAFAEGKKEVALALRSEGGGISFGFGSGHGPSMEVLVSDDRDAVALAETLQVILGENRIPERITQDLENDRIAENGVRTAVTWEAVDLETGEPEEGVLAADGDVTRPKWFQESRNLVAKTTISAGEYQTDAAFYLTVPPQEMPELEDVELTSMLDIGTGDVEKKRKIESIGTVARSRWVGGRKMTYREMDAEGMLVLHLPVEPEKQNYITLKVWEEDQFPGIVVTNLRGRTKTAFEIHEPVIAEKNDQGFYYLTYPIPNSYTRNRTYVSLRLTMMEPEVPAPEEAEEIREEELPEETLPEEESEGEEAEEEKPTVSVYAAYVTQTPYFDPMTFAEQGEPVIKKEEEAFSFYWFLRELYESAEQDADSQNAENSEEAEAEAEKENKGIKVENPDKMTWISGKDEQLMLELPEVGTSTRIYRDTSYYIAYAEMTNKEYHDRTLQAVDYGIYRIFRNRGDKALKIPWKEEELAGLYKNLAEERYYSFLQKGQMVDDSTVPVGTEVSDGAEIKVQPGETLVLMLVAEPLYYPDFKVSEISGQAVAEIKLNEVLEISSMTFRVMGTVPKQEKKLVIFCGIYDRGMLVGMEKQYLTVSPGQVAAEILLNQPLFLNPGQTLKVFVEEREEARKAMTPVLELPQKQQGNEKKTS